MGDRLQIAGELFSQRFRRGDGLIFPSQERGVEFGLRFSSAVGINIVGGQFFAGLFDHCALFRLAERLRGGCNRRDLGLAWNSDTGCKTRNDCEGPNLQI